MTKNRCTITLTITKHHHPHIATEIKDQYFSNCTMAPTIAPVTMTSIYRVSLFCCLLTTVSGWLSVPAVERALRSRQPAFSDFPPSRLLLKQSARDADTESTFSNALVYYYHTNTPSSAASSAVTNKDGDFPFRVSASTDPLLVQQAANETWRWCAHFVAAQNLCPWAQKSVETNQAIRIYVVETIEDMEESLQTVSQQFNADLKASSMDPNAAIAFIVLANDGGWPFPDFYDWYIDEEDNALDDAEEDENSIANHVTWAPFHPEYEFEGDDECLWVEKRSPYPTVSIVSSAVIDSAGLSVTEYIGKNNEEILRKKTASQWQVLYDASVRSKPESL
jgi:hypothetical protein